MAAMAAAQKTGLPEPPPYPALPGMPHFPGKARAVIYLHMNGGHIPAGPVGLQARAAGAVLTRTCPGPFWAAASPPLTNGQGRFPIAPSKFKFTQHGQCGRWVSELLPYTAKIVDEIALVKTVHTNAINHDPACTFVMTGSEVRGSQHGPGCPMVWVRRPGTCRPLWRSCRGFPTGRMLLSALQPHVGLGVSAREAQRAGWCCVPGRIPCCIWKIRPEWTGQTGEPCWMHWVG